MRLIGAQHFSLTTTASIDEATARIAALHSGDLFSDRRIRVTIAPAGERIDFHVRQIVGRYTQTQMHGSLEAQDGQTVITARVVDPVAIIVQTAGLLLAALVVLMLTHVITLPMMLGMMVFVPAMAVRDSVSHRRDMPALRTALEAAFTDIDVQPHTEAAAEAEAVTVHQAA